MYVICWFTFLPFICDRFDRRRGIPRAWECVCDRNKRGSEINIEKHNISLDALNLIACLSSFLLIKVNGCFYITFDEHFEKPTLQLDFIKVHSLSLSSQLRYSIDKYLHSSSVSINCSNKNHLTRV